MTSPIIVRFLWPYLYPIIADGLQATLSELAKKVERTVDVISRQVIKMEEGRYKS